jgi:catechol 2,3-dioxygenase
MKIHELGHVVLYVTDAERSAAFYRDKLGFHQIGGAPHHTVQGGGRGMALFSAGRTHHELLLIEIGGHPREKHRPEPGLYHIGFKIGDGPDALRDVYRELSAMDIPIVGATDHHVTHSLYILDPDGNELELYADINDEWKRDPSAVMKPARPLYLA